MGANPTPATIQHNLISQETQSRFWSKVHKTESCWNWIAGLSTEGYGLFQLNKKSCLAHRLSWIFHNGDIVDNFCVLHKCDNRQCVNPDHLFLGTKGDNNRDMWSKGRGKSRLEKGKRYAPIQHGTANEYAKHGCRCELCIVAVREYWKQRKRVNKSPLPSVLKGHKFTASDG